jgi:prepilin-type N-terminal cleavage/methylation domain-containing protein
MSTRRTAFTLVEMLVVITIIGMLMAMLLPAIQRGREAAKQALCESRQKNLGVGIYNYATSKDRMPAVMSLAPGAFPAGHANFMRNRVWGWIPPLLPELGHADLHDRMLDTVNLATNDYENLFARLYYPEFDCPSDSTRETLDQPWLSYYLNGGRANRAIDGLDNGGYSPELFGYAPFVSYHPTISPSDWRENGACMTRIAAVNPGNANQIWTIDNRPNTLDEIVRGDGTSMTILLAENCSPRYDGFPNTWSNTGIDSSGNPVSDPSGPMEHHNAILWFDHAQGEGLHNGVPVGINQHKDDPLEDDPSHARPASYHPGIVIMTFCDGHTQKVSESIDYRVYALLMSSKGRECKVPGSTVQGPAWQSATVSQANLEP